MVLLASEFDQSRFLRAEGYKQEKKFRIKEVTSEELKRNEDSKSEKKLLVWFTNSEQGLPLNKTNLRTLQGAFGDDTTKWKGKVIVIYPTTAPLRGNMVPALRVRIPPPKQAAAAAAPQPPVTSGNGAAASPPAAAPVTAVTPPAVPQPNAKPGNVIPMVPADPELEPDPVKPIGEDLDDEIAF